MSQFRTTTKNVLSLIFARLGAQLIGFAVTVYLARTLDVSGFGRLNYCYAVATYFLLLTNLGLTIVGTREIGRNRENVSAYLTKVLRVRLVLLAISLFAMLIFVLAVERDPISRKIFAFYAGCVVANVFIIDWVFQGLEKMEFIAPAQIAGAGLYMGLTFLFLRTSSQLVLAPLFRALGQFAVVGILFLAFVRTHAGGRRCETGHDSIALLKVALPLGVSMALIQIVHNADTVILGISTDDTMVGLYGAAQRIILPLVMAGGSLFDALFPVLSRQFKQSLGGVERLQNLIAKIALNVALPVGVSVTILARPIIGLVYGESYGESVRVLQILVWTFSIMLLNMVYARGLWACDRQKKYLAVIALQAGLNIGLNLILIPRFGIIAAAIVKVFSEAMGFFFYRRFFLQIARVKLLRHFPRTLLSTAVLAGVLLLLRNLHVIVLSVIGVAVYAGATMLFGVVGKNDIVWLRDQIMGSRANGSRRGQPRSRGTGPDTSRDTET